MSQGGRNSSNVWVGGVADRMEGELEAANPWATDPTENLPK